MAICKMHRYNAARKVLFTVPALSNSHKHPRHTLYHRNSDSNRSSSHSNCPDGFHNPLVREGKTALKIRFVDQTKDLLYDLKHFYEDFVGNGEVQESQSKVKELQHKLSVLIDRRSACELELIEVKKQLAELNSTQQTVSRGDAQYIELLKQEFKLYSEKQRLDGLLEVLNTEHQLLLMQLTHAFNDVHTKERQEANNVRLVKLFFATLVAVLGFATNAAYNHYKDARVQNHMNMQSQMMKTVVEFVEQEQSRSANKPSTESWGSYLYRQPGRLYGYLFPNQTNESWGSYLQRQPVRLYRYMFRKDS